MLFAPAAPICSVECSFRFSRGIFMPFAQAKTQVGEKLTHHRVSFLLPMAFSRWSGLPCPRGFSQSSCSLFISGALPSLDSQDIERLAKDPCQRGWGLSGEDNSDGPEMSWYRRKWVGWFLSQFKVSYGRFAQIYLLYRYYSPSTHEKDRILLTLHTAFTAWNTLLMTHVV